MVRQGISGDNDKVFVLGPEASRPFGHYRNAIEEDAAPNPEWDLRENLITTEQREVLAAARLIVSAGMAGPPEDPAAIKIEDKTDDDDDFDEDECTEWGNETEADAFNDDELFDKALLDELLDKCGYVSPSLEG